MGLFTSKKLIGIVTIKFYSADKASVEYETEVSGKKQRDTDLIQVFLLYYAKMLYNLNRGIDANDLISSVEAIVEKFMKQDEIKKINILSSGILSKQELISSKSDDYRKKYSGKLYEQSSGGRIIQTHMSAGHEGHYASVSTIMFLQYLIKNISKKHLMFLVLALNGMSRYYQNKDYSKMRSIIEAPNYGCAVASTALNADGQ